MRLRYFLITFTMLFVISVGSVVLHDIFLRTERLNLLDQEVRDAASSLIDIDLKDLRKIDFSANENILAEELGQSKIKRPFVIYDDNGMVIFESKSAKLFHLAQHPRDRQWSNYEFANKYIRVLNLNLPKIKNRALQVGVAVDAKIVHIDYWTRSSLILISVILLLGMTASVLLTSYLLKPVLRISDFINSLADSSPGRPILPNIPDTFFPIAKFFSRDEYGKLVSSLNRLISRVNQNYRFSRLWGYQMAHELKTPLAILNLEIERLQKKLNLTSQDIEPMLLETQRTSETIGSFLSWAELENSSSKPRIFANTLLSVTDGVCRRMNAMYPSRISIQSSCDSFVLSNPQHLEQVIENLIGNALAYSSAESPVKVEIGRDILSITDFGAGIPESVTQRLGEPFNRGDAQRHGPVQSHGLGLAWVNSICRYYSWKMAITTDPRGTKITIVFPESEVVPNSLVKKSNMSHPINGVNC